jgi:hypothetical protein
MYGMSLMSLDYICGKGFGGVYASDMSQLSTLSLIY